MRAVGTSTESSVAMVRDASGNVTRRTDPDGHVTRVEYDGAGNATTLTDPLSRVTTMTYSTGNDVLTVTDPSSVTTTMTYDGGGNRTSVKDGAGRETTFTYDALDRKIGETDPAGRTTTYAYDRSDRQTTLVDAAGRETRLSYDDGSQLQEIDYADSATPDVDYDYDASGQRTRMVDGTGTSTYAYDSLHRLTSATDGAGRQLGYAYDLADRLTKITYPAGLVAATAPSGQAITDPSVTRAYDGAGRVTAITDWLGARTEYDYDRDGNVTGQRYPNQVTAAMSYDRAGRLAQRTDTGPGGSRVLDLPYARRVNGQVRTLNRPGGQPADTQTLTYDSLDQLSEAAAGGQSYGYEHDVADRLTRIASPDVATTLEYDAANQLVRTRDAGTGQITSTFDFDAVGNRTTQDPAGSTASTTYSYDQASRLTHVAGPGAGGADVARDYAYDGDGLRADLLWDSTGDLPLVVGDSAGLYVTGPDGLPSQLTFGGQQRYYHHDQLGSTRALTGPDGATIARYTFDPYGNPTDAASGADSRFGYAGQHTDRATGLIYMRARWYDPATAQFITVDPLGLASGETNLYRYAGGDPTNGVDPTGLFSWDDIGSFAVTVLSTGENIASAPLRLAADGIGEAAEFTGVTSLAQSALEYWAAVAVDPCASGAERFLANVAGGLSALATRDNIGYTALALATARGYARGTEFGTRHHRVAPWGNRTGHPTGRSPHYHCSAQSRTARSGRVDRTSVIVRGVGETQTNRGRTGSR